MQLTAEEIRTPKLQGNVHIDTFLDAMPVMDFKGVGLYYAHWLFMHGRLPAYLKSVYKPFIREHRLFVDYEGKTYLVTGASRMGDIYLATDFNRGFGNGYDQRVTLNFEKLTNWRDTPELTAIAEQEDV